MSPLRRFLGDVKSDWRDMTSATLALLVCVLCLASAACRAADDDRTAAAVLSVLGLGAALYGLTIAARKL